MFFLLYPLSILASVLALSLWFFFQSHKALGRLLRIVFFLALAVYFVALGLQPSPWSVKWSHLIRDLVAMAVVPVLFSVVRNRSWLFFGLLAAFALGFFLSWDSIVGKISTARASYEYDWEWELLVELPEGTSLDRLDALTQTYGLQYERAFTPEKPLDTDLDDYFLVEIPEEREDAIQEILEAFRESGLIDWVERNDEVQVAPPVEAPARPVRKEYGINDPGLQFLWGFEEMDVAVLYQFLRESGVRPAKKALIAILDTGVDGDHEDLKANFQSTKAQYNRDRVGHGTHCAGIAAAVSNNGVGIASFAPTNQFYTVTSIKVLNDFGQGTQASIVNGIIEAADRGADVISMSLGGRSDDKKELAYQKAIRYANQAGAIVVAAAGNNDGYARDISPANSEGVIVVSALDTLLNRASFSNRVQGLAMPLAAPGVAIYSTVPGNQYKVFNGTSMATPYVAGLVGLMKSFQPSLTTQQAYGILRDTGLPTSSPADTGPFIQPGAAVQRLLGL
jgi:thermitase